MLHRRLIYLLLSVVFLTTGCSINEDIDNCNPGLKLKFSYTLNPQYTNLFGSQVKKITVYVFDKDGLYYDTFIEQSDYISNNYEMTLPLPQGTYTVLAWGGMLSSDYHIGQLNASLGDKLQEQLVKGVTHIDDFRVFVGEVSNNNQYQEVVINNLDDLYYGSLTNIQTYADQPTTALVDVIKATHVIDIVVSGVNSQNFPQPVASQDKVTKATSLFDIYCESENGRYKWDLSYDENTSMVKYKNFDFKIINSSTIEAMFRVLRLKATKPIILYVKEPQSGQTIYSADLMQIIRANPQYTTQTEIDREDLYKIMILIGHNNSVSITVNGWEIVSVDPKTQGNN